MATTANTNLQEFTRLPIRIITKADGISPSVIVKTPMGEKIIEFKKDNYSFFGTKTQTEKSLSEIIRELSKLEKESLDYLFQDWLSNNE